MNDEKYREARKILIKYVFDTAKAKGITHEMIAEKTGWHRSNVTRMAAGHYSPSLDNFLKFAECAGVYFFLEDKDGDGEMTKIMRDRHKRPADEN